MDKAWADRVRSPNVQEALPGTCVDAIKSNRCCVCNRPLLAAPWVDLGIGPHCAKKHPNLTERLRERLAPHQLGEEGSDESRVSHLQ